jgi:predicted transglutaminase-like cysteine proteinase
MNAPLGEVSPTHQSPAAMFEKWRTMLDRHAFTKAASCAGESIGCLPSDVLDRLYKLKGDNQMDHLKSVNKLVNRVRYRSDKRQYGTNDYWSSVRQRFAHLCIRYTADGLASARYRRRELWFWLRGVGIARFLIVS